MSRHFRIAALFSLALVFGVLGGRSGAPVRAATPTALPFAVQPIRCAAGVSAAVGTGVRFTGSSGATYFEVTNPASKDGRIEGVIVESACSETVTTKLAQTGLGPVRLKAASAVAQFDIVRIADTQGRWETGNALGRNNYYVAMTAATMANDLFWARPIVGEDRPRVFISGVITGTGASQNTAHGLGSTPTSVMCWLVSVAAGGGAIAAGAHTATNVVETVTTGAQYQCMAMVY